MPLMIVVSIIGPPRPTGKQERQQPRPLIPPPAQLLHDNHTTGVVSTFKNLGTTNPTLNAFHSRKKPLEEAPPETSTANDESTPKKKAKYNKTKNSSRKVQPPPVAEAQLPEVLKNRILEIGGSLDELMLVMKERTLQYRCEQRSGPIVSALQTSEHELSDIERNIERKIQP
ncbi:hypothetical protein ABFX02_01G034800 [Erythranthe guttata]